MTDKEALLRALVVRAGGKIFLELDELKDAEKFALSIRRDDGIIVIAVEANTDVGS